MDQLEYNKISIAKATGSARVPRLIEEKVKQVNNEIKIGKPVSHRIHEAV